LNIHKLVRTEKDGKIYFKRPDADKAHIIYDIESGVCKLGSKVINGLKDFLGINKIDDTSKIETYETPVKTNTLAIQQLDDIDLELESSGNGGGISDVEGSSSDLELDCLDVDLDNVANSNNEKKKEFTFF
jgi:hypothetical protein